MAEVAGMSVGEASKESSEEVQRPGAATSCQGFPKNRGGFFKMFFPSFVYFPFFSFFFLCIFSKSCKDWAWNRWGKSFCFFSLLPKPQSQFLCVLPATGPILVKKSKLRKKRPILFSHSSMFCFKDKRLISTSLGARCWLLARPSARRLPRVQAGSSWVPS